MKVTALGVLAILFLQTGRSPEQPRQPGVTGIEGFVVQAESGEPVVKAQVTLTRAAQTTAPLNPAPPSPSPGPILPTTTDSTGKFAFTDLDPGAYRIIAARNGFVRQNYGERYSGGPGTVITVTAGQTLKDISFRLVQTGTLSGRVRYASGEPAAALGVQLLKPSYNNRGRKTFESVASTRTDDRGDYRLFWVTPGRYLLAVTPGNVLGSLSTGPDGGILDGASPNEVPNPTLSWVYFPGTQDFLAATSFEVGAGRELPGIDLLLPEQEFYRIRGRLVDSTTGQPPRSANFGLQNRDAGSIFSVGRATYNAVTGTFEVRDVPRGRYWIRAGETQSPLDVGGDVEGVVLTVSPGLSISGILRFEGAAPGTTPQTRISLQDATPVRLAAPGLRVNADGTFLLQNVFPGEYRVIVTALTPDQYIKEAKIDQTDVLNAPWTIGEAVRGILEIVVANNAGQIDGTVIDSTVIDSTSKPVSAIQTVLIPDQHRDRADLFKTALTDQDGHFTLRGITPGSYRLFAWEALESNAYFDPEILRPYESQGKAVRVLAGAKIMAEVKVIPAK